MTKLLALLLALGFAAPAWSAVTWSVTLNSDCTAVDAPADCCVTAGNGFCTPEKNSLGTRFIEFVSLVATGTSTYTTGGDNLPALSLSRIGMTGAITFVHCENTSAGKAVVATVTGSNVNIKLFGGNDTAGTTGNGLMAQTPNTTTVTNETMDCMIVGY